MCIGGQTRINRVLNLGFDRDPFAGNYWFAQENPRERVITFFDPIKKNFERFDLAALASPLDAIKTVKSGFSSETRKSTFTLTNSEIQFHDLILSEVRSISFDRFSFISSYLQQDLFRELVVNDENDKRKIPGLFFPETAGWNKSLKVYVPHYENGKLSHMKSPAKF